MVKIIQKAVIKDGEKYLILKRSKSAKYFPECWDFPGGKLEPGESGEEGIIREVKEETTLDVEVGEVVFECMLDLHDAGSLTHKFVIYSVLEKVGDVVLSDEHTEFKWVTKEEILSLKREPYFDLFFEE